MQKIVSQLDRDGYFVAPTAADESPLEPGVFLIPALAVDVAPPAEIAAGKRAKLTAGKWVFDDIPHKSDQEHPAEAAPAIPACNPWQIRKALNALGLRQQVEAAVAASEIQEIHDGWEFATEFRADHPFVLGIAQSIGKTETEVAEIITYASSL